MKYCGNLVRGQHERLNVAQVLDVARVEVEILAASLQERERRFSVRLPFGGKHDVGDHLPLSDRVSGLVEIENASCLPVGVIAPAPAGIRLPWRRTS